MHPTFRSPLQVSQGGVGPLGGQLGDSKCLQNQEKARSEELRARAEQETRSGNTEGAESSQPREGSAAANLPYSSATRRGADSGWSPLPCLLFSQGCPPTAPPATQPLRHLGSGPRSLLLSRETPTPHQQTQTQPSPQYSSGFVAFWGWPAPGPAELLDAARGHRGERCLSLVRSEHLMFSI